MLKLLGISKTSELWLPRSAKELRRHFLTTSDEKTIEETLRVVRKPKTPNQLGAIFGLILTTCVREMNDRGWDTSIIFKTSHPTGDPITEPQLKDYLYAECPMYDEDGKKIHLSDDTCDTKAASDWIDKIMNHAATKWFIYVPSPDPNWKQK